MNAENADKKTIFAHVFSKNLRSSAFISVQKQSVRWLDLFLYFHFHTQNSVKPKCSLGFASVTVSLQVDII